MRANGGLQAGHLACLGLADVLARRVKAGILGSVIAEAVLAAGFVWVWWGGR